MRSAAMSTLSTFAATLPSSTFLRSDFKPLFPFHSTSFCFRNFFSSPKKFRVLYKFPESIFPVESQFSEEEENDEEEEEDIDKDDDDDDDIAAEEYEDVGAELSEEEEGEEEDGGSESSSTVRSGKFEEFKWQRVERLRNDVKEFGEEIITVDELASIYDFRIDKFQRLSIEAFMRGSSVVVSAPTSSGKTLIAEAAAVATAARGKRLFYTTPLKALSNQKFREFRETFGDGNVGLITGDSAINRDAQVVIMTTEILRNMLYQSVGVVSSDSGLLHVDVIVLDEVHYLSDIARGTVWEEIIIYCPKEVQLVCLSATVANPDELAGWIGQIHGKTELVMSSKRPVPLTWHFSTKMALLPLLDEKGISMNKKLSRDRLQHDSFGNYFIKEEGSRRNRRRRDRDFNTHSKSDVDTLRRSQVPQVIDTLWQLEEMDMLPTIWFIFSRKGCDAAVQYLEHCELLDEHAISEVELALKRFRIQYPDAVRESSVKGLLRGVAAHHAGCLPLWKSFIEELFQRGLVKVVFATETLAAGINMPARTAVISSLSKRGESGHIQISSNELLQMAGRAGRRGIDIRGHAVLIQTPYEGAEECFKLLFSGLQPLVSQFTASYGMVLNLLAGAKVLRRTRESDDAKYMQAGRTMEEARKLVEQSFGNYVGSSVMLAAKDELVNIQNEIERLTAEISDEAVDKRSREVLSKAEYKEIAELQEKLRAEKRARTEMRRRLELERLSCLKPLLQDLNNGNLPFLTLQYSDSKGIQHVLPVVYLGKYDQLNASRLNNVVSNSDAFAIDMVGRTLNSGDTTRINDAKPSYYVGLSSENSWYLFTEKSIKMVFKTGLPNNALAKGDALPKEIMTTLLDKCDMVWEKIAESEFGGLWRMEGSLETWAWSLNVPVLSSLSEDDEALEYSQGYHDAVASCKDQRNKVSRLKKIILRTEGFKEYKKILSMAKFKEEKIRRLKARSSRLLKRIEQIEPSGWKEFLQVSNVIHEVRALDVNTHVIFPLGETAAAIRGENELWLAMVLRNNVLLDLKPAQLAAVLGSLVSEGIKARPSKNNSFIYEPSSNVLRVINLLEELRSSLLELQDKHGVQIPCCLDSQFSGMVEAWASGLTWRELMMDCAMDEGDLARLLRRTTDLLAQVPKTPDIDVVLQNNAKSAYDVMDRPPLSELAG